MEAAEMGRLIEAHISAEMAGGAAAASVYTHDVEHDKAVAQPLKAEYQRTVKSNRRRCARRQR